MLKMMKIKLGTDFSFCYIHVEKVCYIRANSILGFSTSMFDRHSADLDTFLVPQTIRKISYDENSPDKGNLEKISENDQAVPNTARQAEVPHVSVGNILKQSIKKMH